MENINRIEITGTVGNIKTAGIGITRIAHLSVATNYTYRDVEGNPVIETTWHSVTAFQGKNIANLDSISKGTKVRIVGRLRNQRYTASNGDERYSTDVLASELSIVKE